MLSRWLGSYLVVLQGISIHSKIYYVQYPSVLSLFQVKFEVGWLTWQCKCFLDPVSLQVGPIDCPLCISLFVGICMPAHREFFSKTDHWIFPKILPEVKGQRKGSKGAGFSWEKSVDVLRPFWMIHLGFSQFYIAYSANCNWYIDSAKWSSWFGHGITHVLHK